MLKTICKDDLISTEKMEINCMLSNLYFECGFLGSLCLWCLHLCVINAQRESNACC